MALVSAYALTSFGRTPLNGKVSCANETMPFDTSKMKTKSFLMLYVEVKNSQTIETKIVGFK